MKIVIANDWYSDKQGHYTNKDGFLRCLDIFQRDYKWEVIFIKKSSPGYFQHPYVLFKYVEDVKSEILNQKPDCILLFSDLSRPLLGELRGCGIPIAQAFTGGAYDKFEDVPDIIFVESQVYYDRFKAHGRNVVKAFGTNTEVFKPMPQPKIFDACQTCTFAGWKRHELFAEALGGGKYKALACGWWQPHEPQCWQICQEKGIVLLHHQNAESVNLIYNMSRTCVLTADNSGGSQRSVLEAMAVGIPPIVMSDNDKTTEFVRESGFGKIVLPEPSAIRNAVDELIKSPPDSQIGINYIKSKYTEHHYAEKLKKGIESIC
jgi:glycosyltransferase involved in cell wall biosynthesis